MVVKGSELRTDARAIIDAALEAVDPYRLVRAAVTVTGEGIGIAGEPPVSLDSFAHVYVAGAGKAAAPMTAAIEEILGARMTAGLAVTREGYLPSLPGRVELLEAAHPVPNERSVQAAERLLELAGRAGSGDLVIFLLSGGASALMALPAGELSLDDVRQATQALVNSGASISEINSVRKHITAAAGGRLAAAASPATLVTLALSDVIGDDPGVIGSGPTWPDETTFTNALAVISHYQLGEQLPPAVVAHLQAGQAGRLPETPKPGAPVFGNSRYHVLAGNRTALEAAALKAAALGYRVVLEDAPLLGDAGEEAHRLLDGLREALPGGGPGAAPLCLLAGGETTVRVTGTGKGGRAQQFALAAAMAMEGVRGALLFACGTDGADGPTDAAGAFADRSTVTRARAAGLEPAEYLENNDSYRLFDRIGDHIITGPTGTNVNDIYGVLMG